MDMENQQQQFAVILIFRHFSAYFLKIFSTNANYHPKIIGVEVLVLHFCFIGVEASIVSGQLSGGI